MTGSTAQKPDARQEVTLPYRRIGWTVLRVLASAAIVVTAYYLLPFDRAATWGAITLLVLGLLALIGLIAFQVRAIGTYPFAGAEVSIALPFTVSVTGVVARSRKV